MAAIEITIDGVVFDKQWRTYRPIVITGQAFLTGYSVGGGPIMPPDQPPISDAHPEHPIYYPPGSLPHPSHPIALPGDPWWPKPPVTPPSDPGVGKPPPPEGGWGWHPEYGWGYFPGTGGQPGPKG